MKKENKITLKKLEVGEFEVRVSEAKVTFQSKNKLWKTEYLKGTYPYDFTYHLVDNNGVETLEALMIGMYNQALFFTDAKLLQQFLDLIKEKLENTEPSKDNEEEAIEDVKNIERFKTEVINVEEK